MDFENRYVPTKEMYKDYFKNASHAAKLAKIEGWLILLITIAGLVAAYLSGMGMKVPSALIFGILGGIFLMNYSRFLTYRTYKEECEAGGGLPEELSVLFKKDGMEVKNTFIPYEKVWKIYDSAENIFIIFGKDLVVTVGKDSFVTGDKSRFKEYLEKKTGKNFIKV